MSEKVARRYARTIFELAQEKNQVKKVYADLSAIKQLADESNEFETFLKSPIVSKSVQKDVIDKLFKKKANSLTLSSLLFLIEKEKLSYLPQICLDFEKRYLNFSGVLKIKLISAHKILKSQVDAICSKLKKHFQKDVEAQVQENPNLIAGFKVEIGDLVYDLSVRGQLEKIKQEVMSA